MPPPAPSKPIKVLQICAVDFTLARFLAPFCFYLKEKGFDVTAACAESAFMASLRERGLRCVNLPIERSRNLGAHVRSYRRLSAWLRDEPFDIVHVHTPIAALIGRLAAARRRAPIRIYTAHGFYFHDAMPGWQRRVHVVLERFGARFHHYLFTQSDEDRAAAIRCRISPEDRVRAIGNGVDLERFNPERFSDADREATRAALGISREARVLAIIGRLVREKGYFELFRASARLADRFPDFRLLVIGDALASDHDDSTNDLRELVDALGIHARIIFAGQRDDVPELLHASDVFALPSYREGMPRSVIEAMAMALPAVVTDIRGCREEVVDGETGFIIPARDDEALAERCGRLLADPDAARAMGRAGRSRARDLFSERVVFERQIEIYEELIRERLPRQAGGAGD
jgi:glycosyltransferase involved in cell wall biosynthesis